MRVRAAVLADALPAACERLDAAARGAAVAGLWTGAVPPGGADDHVALDADASAEAVAAAFVRGADVPFAALFPQPWRRLALPAYAFQRRHFNVPPRPRPPATDAHAPPAPAAATDVRARVHAAAPAARAALLARHVQERCAAVLRLDPDEIAPDEPLADLGFDSLRAAELAAALERDLGVPLPFADLVDGASAADVGAAIARRWHDAATGATAPAAGAAAPRAAARHGPEARGDG
jgi:acyl carrier protein